MGNRGGRGTAQPWHLPHLPRLGWYLTLTTDDERLACRMGELMNPEQRPGRMAVIGGTFRCELPVNHDGPHQESDSLGYWSCKWTEKETGN
jgi:hypothetical protein